MQNYLEATQFLFSQLPMFQRVGASAYKNKLDNSYRLDQYFNFPHRKFKSIHVGGTNGKGSVSHMLASILQEAGYKTGLYTSPHLRDFRERIKVNGEMISEKEVVDFVNHHHDIITEIKPSFFEMTVAMAFDYFAKKEVDMAVVEVGLGGRLDSTNIITPALSVITNIGLDHVSILGDSIEDIAKEKAGIMKPKVPVVVGRKQTETNTVFAAAAEINHTSITYSNEQFQVELKEICADCRLINIWRKDKLIVENLKFPLLGIYQSENIATALTSIDQLIYKGVKIASDAVKSGLEKTVQNTSFMGRWHVLNKEPMIVCDTGHNIDGMRKIVEQLSNEKYEQLHFILGMAEDKDVDEVLSVLPKHAHYYFTRADSPRSLNHEELRQKGKKHQLYGESYHSIAEALTTAKKRASANDLIFIGGSSFVVAEVI